ncbi:hypothetical protein CEXT_352871 [Caerostris extrusa]|uniref:Uncharacterized protein n=1 Tax=Caerostris extrusa TaxID=172846 RepID=A0AAV4MFY8_CAEEX|nr:hypothetical protein CEXT_352871 [Caerostris extrusa]
MVDEVSSLDDCLLTFFINFAMITAGIGRNFNIRLVRDHGGGVRGQPRKPAHISLPFVLMMGFGVSLHNTCSKSSIPSIFPNSQSNNHGASVVVDKDPHLAATFPMLPGYIVTNADCEKTSWSLGLSGP